MFLIFVLGITGELFGELSCESLIWTKKYYFCPSQNNSFPSHRAPELILCAMHYTCAIDVWSCGCVLGELLLNQPLFPGETGVDQLVEIIKILGTPSREQTDDMNPEANKNFHFPLVRCHPWARVFRNRTPQSALDLANSILEFSPQKRITSIAALSHHFFDDLRDCNQLLPNGNHLPMRELYQLTVDECSTLIDSKKAWNGGSGKDTPNIFNSHVFQENGQNQNGQNQNNNTTENNNSSQLDNNGNTNIAADGTQQTHSQQPEGGAENITDASQQPQTKIPNLGQTEHNNTLASNNNTNVLDTRSSIDPQEGSSNNLNDDLQNDAMIVKYIKFLQGNVAVPNTAEYDSVNFKSRNRSSINSQDNSSSNAADNSQVQSQNGNRS